MNPSNNNQMKGEMTIRKPYNKPCIIRIKLVTKEAVLAAGCKTELGPGSDQSICLPFSGDPCYNDGS